jgi:hypothetical protein
MTGRSGPSAATRTWSSGTTTGSPSGPIERLQVRQRAERERRLDRRERNQVDQALTRPTHADRLAHLAWTSVSAAAVGAKPAERQPAM